MKHDLCTEARIEHITPLTDSILQVILTPHSYIDYQAGQYLQIIHQQEPFSYSIANAPLGAREYELHIRHGQNVHNQSLLADIKRFGSVNICLPMGECHLKQLYSKKPILFIAGGTGFAPIKAMIEQLLADGETRPFELYWGARSQSDLYMDDMIKAWRTHVSCFQYFSQTPEVGQTSLASLVLAEHAHDLNDWQIVINGPPDMVFNTRDQLLNKGALHAHLFSDMFPSPHHTTT